MKWSSLITKTEKLCVYKKICFVGLDPGNLFLSVFALLCLRHHFHWIPFLCVFSFQRGFSQPDVLSD